MRRGPRQWVVDVYDALSDISTMREDVTRLHEGISQKDAARLLEGLARAEGIALGLLDQIEHRRGAGSQH